MLEPFCLSLLLRWIRSPTAMPLLHDMRSLTLVLVISRALMRRSMIAVSLLTSSLPFRVWMRVSMLCVLTTSSLSCVIGLASMSILCVKTSCTSSSCSASVRPSLEGILMFWIALLRAARVTESIVSVYLCRRFHRFFNTQDARHAADSSRVTAFHLIGAPPKVLGAVLKAWLNAWPMQSPHGAPYCPLCNAFHSVRSMHHLASCEFVQVLCRRFEISSCTSLGMFPLLKCRTQRECKIRAVVLYITHDIFCICQAQGVESALGIIPYLHIKYGSVIHWALESKCD